MDVVKEDATDQVRWRQRICLMTPLKKSAKIREGDQVVDFASELPDLSTEVTSSSEDQLPMSGYSNRGYKCFEDMRATWVIWQNEWF